MAEKAMYLQLRLYKRFDADLISLQASGISIPSLARMSLKAYTTGEKLCVEIPDISPPRYEEIESLHFSVAISDRESRRILRAVAPGARNAFCKALIRASLSTIPLAVFFTGSDQDSERERIRERNRIMGALPFKGARSVRRTAAEVLKDIGITLKDDVPHGRQAENAKKKSRTEEHYASPMPDESVRHKSLGEEIMSEDLFSERSAPERKSAHDEKRRKEEDPMSLFESLM